MLYAEEVDALAEATAVDVTEEGRVELWQFCRAATGLDGEALSSVLSNLDKEDADMLSALRATCATWEPNKVAKVVRALLRWLRDDVGLVPLDKPVVEPTTAGPGRAPKRARPYGSVGVLQKSTEELAEYKHSRYVAKQQDMMQDIQATYPWLASDETRGYDCRFCIDAAVKASDKLSRGYGFTGKEGDPGRALVPIPAAHKLRTHEEKEQHIANAKEAGVREECMGGGQTVPEKRC